MRTIRTTYVEYFKNKKFVISFFLSFVFLIIALIIEFYANQYALEKASNPVTDIILNNIPVFNVDFIFVYGPWMLWIFLAGITISKPNQIPFIVKSIALLVLIRSAFITLTHTAEFPIHSIILPSIAIDRFSSGADLFFSSHTGLPFLLALIFWDTRYLRYLFIFLSIFFGIVVLLGHLHYSIDVFSAFFITYSIYHISEYIFRKDKLLFDTPIEIIG